jgi:putative ABC transport system substrate-binding protein
MQRRQFILALGGAAAAGYWPRGARAQQADGIRRIGVLMITADTDPEAQADRAALTQALEKLGWAQGKNLDLQFRFAAGDPGRLASLAAELVAMKPDLIVAQGTPGLAATQQATKTLPIIFTNVTDPVGQGFVPQLARPGGNITGFALFEFSMGGKWLELLKSLAPWTKQVALLFNPKMAPYAPLYFHSVEAAAPRFDVQPVSLAIDDEAGVERGLADLARQPDTGLIVLLDAFTHVHRDFIIKQTVRHKIPTIFTARYFADSGGLLAYGVDITEQFRQTAGYANRILKGAKAGDLPVQQPTKFELVINLKTAKAVGVNVPPALLTSADDVIE